MVLNLVGAASVPQALATVLEASGWDVAEASTTHLGGSLLPLERGGTALPPTVVTVVALVPNTSTNQEP